MAPKDQITIPDAPGYVVRPLRLFVVTDFFAADRHAMRAAIAYAKDEAQARELVDRSLERAGLLPSSRYRYQLRELSLDSPFAEVLNSGKV